MDNTMKTTLIAPALLACLVTAAPASALEIWHSNTVWANQGMCSATFMLDSGMEETGPLEIGVELVNAKGVVIASDTLNVDALGVAEATRYHLPGAGFWPAETAATAERSADPRF